MCRKEVVEADESDGKEIVDRTREESGRPRTNTPFVVLVAFLSEFKLTIVLQIDSERCTRVARHMETQ